MRLSLPLLLLIACRGPDKGEDAPATGPGPDTATGTTDSGQTDCVPTEEIPYDGIDQDCDDADLTDVDGDGHDGQAVGGDDCDDSNADIAPGLDEIPYDGIDQDCDGSDPTDLDEDGWDAAEAGGEDCDDGNAEVNPAAIEVCNELDDDCDGTTDTMIAGVTHATIQEAIDDACEGGTVEVVAGTWLENLLITGNDLVLRSQDGKETTILDGSACTTGEDSCSVIALVEVGPDAAVEGFTITGGRGSLPSVYGTESQYSEVSGGAGGGVFLHHAAPTLRDLLIEDNELSTIRTEESQSAIGGGVLCWRTSWTDSAGGEHDDPAVILDSTIRGHQIWDTTSEDRVQVQNGGGIAADSCDLVLESVEITDNAAAKGAGLWWTGTSERSVVDSVTFSNSRAGAGGGIYIKVDIDVSVFTSCVFEGNEAQFVGGGAAVFSGTGTWNGTNTWTDNLPDDCYGDPCP